MASACSRGLTSPHFSVGPSLAQPWQRGRLQRPAAVLRQPLLSCFSVVAHRAGARVRDAALPHRLSAAHTLAWPSRVFSFSLKHGTAVCPAWPYGSYGQEAPPEIEIEIGTPERTRAWTLGAVGWASRLLSARIRKRPPYAPLPLPGAPTHPTLPATPHTPVLLSLSLPAPSRPQVQVCSSTASCRRHLSAWTLFRTFLLRGPPPAHAPSASHSPRRQSRQPPPPVSGPGAVSRSAKRPRGQEAPPLILPYQPELFTITQFTNS